MPTSVENYIFNELPRRVSVDSSISTGSSLTTSWLLVATGNGFQAVAVDPSTLGFEPTVVAGTPAQYYRGDKTWATLNSAAVGAIAASEKGQPLGVATLDANGFVYLSQMNPAVIERVVVVADEAARYALTTAQVQNGDVVNQQSPSPASMWYVYDDQNLDNSSGYLPFSSGVAASVAWSGITDKPAIIGDLESISLAAEGDLIQYIAGHWVKVDPLTVKGSLQLEIADIDQLETILDLKQSQSPILDEVSNISTSGVLVRKSDDTFTTRTIVGTSGVQVTNGNGDADNPSVSLIETGVSPDTYGDDYHHAIIEVDEFGRVVSASTAISSSKEPIYIPDSATVQLQGNTEHIFGRGVPSYTSAITLELPDNVPGGTWVRLVCAQDFYEAQDSVSITAPIGTTIQGAPSFPFSASFKLYPFTTVNMIYSSTSNDWTLLTNSVAMHTYLYVARPGATAGSANSHSFISQATSSRSILLPDSDVDLSQVGVVEFSDAGFNIYNSSDISKKIFFNASSVDPGVPITISVPNYDVDLGQLSSGIFLDGNFRIKNSVDDTKAVSFDVSPIATGQTRVVVVPDSDVDLGKISQAASTSTDGYLTSADWNTFNDKQSGDVVLSATGTTLTLSAGTNYRILVSANTTINCGALTGTVQFINVQTLNRTITFNSTPQAVSDVVGSVITSAVLTGFTQAWLAPNPSIANTLRYQKPNQTLASEVSWASTANSSINRMTWSAIGGFTAARTYTLADKDVNFGDLPSVGTTNGNSLTGTRPNALGCTSTTVAGTNNVAIGCFSCTINGTSNLAQSCYNVTTNSNHTNCLFVNLHNDYIAPLAPWSFGGFVISNVEYTGWLNILVAALAFPKGYKVKGHKHRKVTISGVTDTRVAAVDTEVFLAATSSTSNATFMCASDTSAYPLNFAANTQTYVVKHEVDIKGISEISGHFEGRRLITYHWSGGSIRSQSIETVGTDRISGTFTPSITMASATQVSGVYRLDIIVQNTANTQQVFWEATLRSSCEHLYVTV